MKRYLIAFIALLGFASYGHSEEMLDGEQVRDLLVGNTLQADYKKGARDRHTFFEYYAEDGKIFGREKQAEQTQGYTKYLGTWSVKDGEFCTNLAYGHRGGCSVFKKTDEDTFVRMYDGAEIDHARIHSGRFIPAQ